MKYLLLALVLFAVPANAMSIQEASRKVYGAIEERSMYIMETEMGNKEYDPQYDKALRLNIYDSCKIIGDITGNYSKLSCLLNMRRHTGIL